MLSKFKTSTYQNIYSFTWHFKVIKTFNRIIFGKLQRISVMYYKSKKKRSTPIHINTNYRTETEMKLVPIIMDNCLLQFDALKFFLRVCLHGRSLPNINFFDINPPNFSTKS